MIEFRSCWALLALLTLSMAACSSTPQRPMAEFALAKSALVLAENSGARDFAPIELRVARQKLRAADEAMAAKQYQKAKMLTVEARVDAELASAVARMEKSRFELGRAQNGIKVIRQQISESTDQ